MHQSDGVAELRLPLTKKEVLKYRIRRWIERKKSRELPGLLFGVGLSRAQVLELARFALEENRAPSPPIVKTLTILQYQSKYHCEVFVETGTFFGDTTSEVSSQFESCHTIELSDYLAELARLRFAHKRAVTVHQGTSSEVLPKILSQLRIPALFWLDAHHSGGVTANAGYDPIELEVKALLNHSVKNHVILIDDARGLGMPIQQISELIRDTGNHYSFSNYNDIIRLVPKI